MITGGYLNYYSRAKVWLYDWTEDEWSKGPSLNYARREHMCLSLGQGKVMVAGGTGLYGVVLTDVEVFDNNLGEWTKGVDLPERTRSENLLNWNGNPLLISGQSWVLKDGKWTMLNVKSGNGKFAINVPGDFCYETPNITTTTIIATTTPTTSTSASATTSPTTTSPTASTTITTTPSPTKNKR